MIMSWMDPNKFWTRLALFAELPSLAQFVPPFSKTRTTTAKAKARLLVCSLSFTRVPVSVSKVGTQTQVENVAFPRWIPHCTS